MRLLRVKEAADFLGLKTASIRELDRRGELTAVRDWADHRRFREDDLVAFRERLLSGGMRHADGD